MEQQRGRQTTPQEKGDSSHKIRELIKKIKAEDFTFSQLKPEEYAPLDGYAYQVAVKQEGDKGKPRIKITQLRKFFSQIKRLEAQLVKLKKDDDELDEAFYAELYLIVPELAYAKGRDLIDQDFFELMRVSLDKAKFKRVRDFRTFAKFVTAVLAYSKYVKKD